MELVRQALQQDRVLTENQIELSDADGLVTKLSLWSNPGSGTLGMLIRRSELLFLCACSVVVLFVAALSIIIIIIIILIIIILFL